MNDFYEQLTPFYHMIFADWEASIASYGRMLDEMIQARWGPDAGRVLDVSCGIGTQSLGLAARGYEVTASDLSAAGVARAQEEAAARGLTIDFSVGDMRQAHILHGSGYDVVISAGNSVPHLLGDEEIGEALAAMRACLRPGGGCIITMRQYDQQERGRGLFHPFRVHDEDDRRTIIFQIWDFEGDEYDLAMYFVHEDLHSGEIRTDVMYSRYYALSPDRLGELMERAGFAEVERLDDGTTPGAILVGTNP